MCRKCKMMVNISLIICILFGVLGCDSDVENSLSNEPFSPKEAIKIEEIDWKINESIMDGEKFISLDYTNNSEYTILDVEIEFKQKEDVTDEQLGVFDKLKEYWSWDEEDVKNVYILGYNRKCAEPGETVSDSPLVINGTYILAESMEQVDIMEPNMVTIAFIGKDGKGYTIYYDYKSNTYGESSYGATDLHQWSESEISGLLPKAEFKAVNVSSDEEDRFFFYAYGVSIEEFNAYVDEIKEKGFTDVQFESGTSYRALNSDNIEANITYDYVEEQLTGCVEKY